MSPAFHPDSRPSDFFRGLALPFRAISLLFRSKRLFWLAAFASLVTLVSLAGLVVVLGLWTDDFIRRFVFEPHGGLGDLVYWILVTVTFLLFLVIGANTVPLLLLTPLQDPISEATEAACGGFTPPAFSIRELALGAWVGLGHNLARIAYLLGGHALLLLLNLIPAAGSALWTVTSALWTMAWLSAEYLDTPMARYHYPFREVRRVVRARLPLCLGFGAAIYILLWVPVLNLFFIPLAVIAGTLLFRGLRACGSIATPTA